MANHDEPSNNVHDLVEKNVGALIVLICVAISFATLVEIVPLFFQKDLNEPLPNMKPLTALQMEGRDIYIREGCNVCHSQMIRPLRAETERYGHYSVAAESVWDHPFLWGSKRTGPDLARIGEKYSDDWHHVHMINPRDVVPESVMPGYPWLAENKLTGELTAKKLEVFRNFGVPYTDADIAGAAQSVKGKTEMEALIAYLQQLGTAIKARR
ncbi:MAG: cytochrome-c oxidase, cbb3-type subunit II [Agitococcus sp.]|jgi:cytochrome c oxidase cbb3-type subunit 2|nr:cytochrome-c oxidase, cbb3-type subunit II [Moraxellaceae bacterium]MBP9215951.1 cytochrome-c oxidase, cbb3-type subunit II [Agitococcus sp.]MBK7299597.1 cytochrome-c oxidase, cbb3-type subunit II [Moraxellaceae bacterium]MBK8326420.1 cytochrome-c oxidase, cbb3-type subunit II [Moraxellaceae bacterium]MBK9185991.1 cytochrome-c oxidase, cbb3-type subunit II [Moraxellaceae bacterium]